MVAAAFLPEPRPFPGSHHGGLRSSAGRPCPPRPILHASLRPPWRLPSAQSLRSGASLPGERPGQAPGSCSGSPSPTRPELRRRGRAGRSPRRRRRHPTWPPSCRRRRRVSGPFAGRARSLCPPRPRSRRPPTRRPPACCLPARRPPAASGGGASRAAQRGSGRLATERGSAGPGRAGPPGGGNAPGPAAGPCAGLGCPLTRLWCSPGPPGALS